MVAQCLKALGLVLFLGQALLPGARGEQLPFSIIRGSGRVVTEARQVKGFHRIALSGTGKLVVTQGSKEALSIEAEDNIMPLIKTTISDEELRIDYKLGPRQGLSPTKPVIFYLTVNHLSAVHIRGSGAIESQDLRTDELSLEVSGSGTANLTVRARQIRSRISGSGDFALAGAADKQRVEISGSGNYRARHLKSKGCEIRIGGSGSAEVNATERLDVRISGNGTVSYVGDPILTKHIAGTGSVNRISL